MPFRRLSLALAAGLLAPALHAQAAATYPALIPQAGQISNGCAAASEAGQWLALGQPTGNELVLFDTRDFSILRIEHPAVTLGVCPMAASPDGRWLAVGGSSGLVFDVQNWRQTPGQPPFDAYGARLAAPQLGAVCGFVLGPSGHDFLAWNDRGQAEVLRVGDHSLQWSGVLPGVAPGRGCSTMRPILGPEGAWLATAGYVLNLRSGKTAPLPTGAYLEANWAGHDGFLYAKTTANTEFALDGYEVEGGRTSTLYERAPRLDGAMFLADGTGLVTARSRDVRIWDLASNGTVRQVPTAAFNPAPLVRDGAHGFGFFEGDFLSPPSFDFASGSGERGRSLSLPNGLLPAAHSPSGDTVLALNLLGAGKTEWLQLDAAGLRDLGAGPTFRGGFLLPVAVADEGRRFVFATAVGATSVTVMQAGKVPRELAPTVPAGPGQGAPLPVAGLALSPDGRWLAVSRYAIAPGSGTYVWDLDEAGAQPAYTLPGLPLAFSPDGRSVLVCTATCGLYRTADGAPSASLGAAPNDLTAAAFSADGKWLAFGTLGGELELWSVPEHRLRATLMMFADGGWLAATPEGLFDGSPEALTHARWRFSDRLRDVAPVEIFLNEYYHPGLLPEILRGGDPRPAAAVATLDRRQPSVTLALENGGAGGAQPRSVRVRLKVAPAAPGRDPVSGRSYAAPSGVRDVRLFRNGTLIQEWHGEQTRRTLDATVTLTAGANQLTAYAFSDSGIKSEDAALELTGSPALARPATAYVLAIGINHYGAAAGLPTLKFAVADADDAAATLAAGLRGLGTYQAVVPMVLSDGAASRAGIAAAFRGLAARVQPEDSVIIYYAGHGVARGDRFYLLPADLDRAAFDAGRFAASGAVSDRDLESWLEPLPAAHLLLVLDACDSGAAIGPAQLRIGPLDSTGLGQLAFEKGLDILAASQASQSANENSRLGHGLLTYALLQEGIEQGKAAVGGRIEVRHWLEYTAAEVPRLMQEILDARAHTRGFPDDIAAAAAPAQYPRYYFRREPDLSPFVLAPAPSSGSRSR